MVSLFGSFWISPENEIHDTAGKAHMTYISGRQLLGYTEAIERGWVRVAASISGGLNLYIEGKESAIERAKEVILSHWGHAPEKIVVDVDEPGRQVSVYTDPDEFYSVPLSGLVYKAAVINRTIRERAFRRVDVKNYNRRCL